MARAAETTVGDRIARGGWVKHPVRCIFVDFDTAWPPSGHEKSSWAIESNIQSKPFAQQLCAKKTCKSCLPLMYRTAATQLHRSPAQMDKAGAQHWKDPKSTERPWNSALSILQHSCLQSWDKMSEVPSGQSWDPAIRGSMPQKYTHTTQMTTSSNALTPVLQKGLLHSNLWPFGLNGKVFWVWGFVAHKVLWRCLL